MKLNDIPEVKIIGSELRFCGYYEWYANKKTNTPVREAIFDYDYKEGKAISDFSYYLHQELWYRYIPRDLWYTREETYQLVRKMFCKGEKEVDILECEVVQCSLF